MNSQLLASALGLTATPVNNPSGGTNYAIAGAYTAADSANSNQGNRNADHSLPSTVQQLNNYLSAHGGVADPGALFLVSTGGNDISYANDPGNFATLAAKEAFLQTQADALATALHSLEAAGAQHVIVNDLYGTGTLATFWNSALSNSLNSHSVNYVLGDIHSVVAAVQADPTDFGFTAQTVLPGIVGVGNTSSAFITETGAPSTVSGWGQWGANTTTPSSSYAYLRSADAEQTSLFSDDQHFSAAGQKIEANYDYGLLVSNHQINIDTIDLKDISFTLGKTQASFAGDTTHGVLTVTDGIHSVNLSLVGNYLSSTFGTISDGNGGTIVYDPPGATPASSVDPTVAQGATVELKAAYAGEASFTGTTGTLQLDAPATFAGTISGFTGDGTLAGSDHINLLGFNCSSIQSSYDSSTGILTVADGTAAAELHFAGNYSQNNFKFADDGTGGTIVYDPVVPGQSTSLVVSDTTDIDLGGNGTANVAVVPGQDAFVFAKNLGNVTISNFAPAMDSIQISHAAFANVNELLAAAVDDAHGNVIITDTAHDTLTIQHVTVAQLHVNQNDFHIV
jgi:hypothetical protein